MHELPITKSILDIVLRHATINRVEKVISVSLCIGVLSDIEPEYIQRYFDWITKGTVAEGASLKISSSPLILLCPSCSWSFEQDISSEVFTCPECGAKDGFRIVSGKGYFIQDMEVR